MANINNLPDEGSTEEPLQIGDVEGHACFVKAEDSKLRATCECGCVWTYNQFVTVPEMVSIYESHIDYSKRPKAETL